MIVIIICGTPSTCATVTIILLFIKIFFDIDRPCAKQLFQKMLRGLSTSRINRFNY